MSRWLEGHKAVSTELPLHILTAFPRVHLAFTACLVRLLKAQDILVMAGHFKGPGETT